MCWSSGSSRRAILSAMRMRRSTKSLIMADFLGILLPVTKGTRAKNRFARAARGTAWPAPSPETT